MLGVISVQGRSDPEEMLTFSEDVLNRAMREIHDRLRRGPLLKKLEAASRREMRANQRVMELTDHLRDRQELARENGVALEPDDPQLLVSVKRDNLALRAELAGLRAQQKAITEQTYVATDRLAAGKTDEDLIREGLQKVLKLRQEERARLLQLCESGHASELEVTQAEVAIAKAEADLAEFRRMQAQQFESGPLGRLNERLVETRIAISTAQARLEETDKAIEQLERSSYDPANPLVMEVQQARREMDSAWAELQAAFAERARLAAACEALPSPEVILIRKP